MNIILLTYAKDTFEVASIDRLIHEAESRGHHIKRIRYLECSLATVDGQCQVFHHGEELKADAVIPWIIQGGFNYGMDVLRQFESAGVTTLNGSDAFNNATNKWRTAQLLAQNNVAIPKTYRAYEYQDMYPHIENLADETIVKILTGTRGNGVILSPTQEATKSIAATLGVLRSDYIVQEFVEGSRGVDIRAYVVGGKVIAAMERRATSGFRANLHHGGVGQSVILTEEENDLAVRACVALGLNSAGIDFMRSDKEPVVIEANASGEFGIEKVTGINVAGTIIDYIELLVESSEKKVK